jgi:parvulin-like peptidyl-prolyl isomerase
MKYTIGLVSILGAMLALCPLAGGACETGSKPPLQRIQRELQRLQHLRKQIQKQQQQQEHAMQKSLQDWRRAQQRRLQQLAQREHALLKTRTALQQRMRLRALNLQKQQPKTAPQQKQTAQPSGQRTQQRQQTQQRQPQARRQGQQGSQAQGPQVPPQYRPAPLPAGDTVVATVNGEPIRAREIIQLSYDWFAATTVEELILERIIEQEARAQGVSVSPAEVEANYKRQLQNAESQLPPGMSLEDFLKRNQFPPSRLFARLRSQLLVEKLVERQVNLDDFVEYSQIMIRIQGNTPEQQEENTPTAEAKAREVYQKILEGLDFTEAVKEYSDDPFSKDRGGKMNWQNIKFIPSDVRQKLQEMKPGEVSEPFKALGSYMIIRKERIGSQATPAEQQDLRQQAVRLEFNEYLRQLQSKAKITNTIVKPYDPEAAAASEPGGSRPPEPRPRPPR